MVSFGRIFDESTPLKRHKKKKSEMGSIIYYRISEEAKNELHCMCRMVFYVLPLLTRFMILIKICERIKKENPKLLKAADKL